MTVYYLHQSESEYVNAPLVSTPARNFSLSGGVNMIFTRTRDRPFFARKPCFLWRGPPNSGIMLRNWDRRPGRTAALAARAGAGSLRFDPLIIPVKRHRGEPGPTRTHLDHTDEPHNQPAHTGTRVCQTCVCPCVPCPGSVLEWISQISSLRSCRNSVQYRVLFRRNSSVNSSAQCSMRESFRRVDADSRPFCARLGTRVANARCTHHSALGHSTLGQIRMFASPLPPAATDMPLKAAAEQAAAEKAAAEKAAAEAAADLKATRQTSAH